MAFTNMDVTTVEEGIEELKKTVSVRNTMGGALYYNILNEECLKLADKLIGMGADRDILAEIMGTWDYR